jgi:hypothetical protein
MQKNPTQENYCDSHPLFTLLRKDALDGIYTVAIATGLFVFVFLLLGESHHENSFWDVG